MTPEHDALLDMLEYIQHIETFTADGRDAFFADVKTQMAVIRAYEVIGQIAKDLPTTLLDTQPQAEWKKVKGFRDFLATITKVSSSRLSGVRSRSCLCCAAQLRHCWWGCRRRRTEAILSMRAERLRKPLSRWDCTT